MNVSILIFLPGSGVAFPSQGSINGHSNEKVLIIYKFFIDMCNPKGYVGFQESLGEIEQKGGYRGMPS